jgi:hypothetical protein
MRPAAPMESFLPRFVRTPAGPQQCRAHSPLWTAESLARCVPSARSSAPARRHVASLAGARGRQSPL